MSALNHYEKRHLWKPGFSCIMNRKPVFFSFVIEEPVVEKQSFAPVSYHLREFRKAVGIQVDNYENDFEDHYE